MLIEKEQGEEGEEDWISQLSSAQLRGVLSCLGGVSIVGAVGVGGEREGVCEKRERERERIRAL
jgi:hypothetical protein